MLEIDGSEQSGSGTLVRLSVAIAALLGEDLRLFNIRARRRPPGLRHQHLRAVQAVADLCAGQLEGACLGASQLEFHPRSVPRTGSWQLDIGTAGSTTMLAQTLLPAAVFARGTSPVCFRITGGLFQDFAPSPYHLQWIVLPLLARMGVRAELHVRRPGYVPAGSGEIELVVWPVSEPLKPLVVGTQRGEVSRIRAVALASHLLERRVAERMAEAFLSVLSARGLTAEVEVINDTSAAQAGAGFAAVAETDAGCVLGADRAGAVYRSSERVARDAAGRLLRDLDSGATVDRFAADQLIVYAALAGGTTEYSVPELTEHVQSNLWLLDRLLGPHGARFEVNGRCLRITGIGYTARRVGNGAAVHLSAEGRSI
jgi:RNA 3'-terminal phosphate cyclase (ATP)